MNKRKTVLIVDDERSIQIVLQRALEAECAVLTASSAEDGLQLMARNQVDLVLLDVNMPGGMDGMEALSQIQATWRIPVIIMTARSGMQSVIEAMKRSAFDFVPKPFDIDQIRRLVADALAGQPGSNAGSDRVPEIARQDFEQIIGQSAAMRDVFKLIGRAAPAPVTVLIEGESGTGKELVARVIHQNSRRAEAPFIPVNLAAIPEELMESEFFGHERGAFTGATARRAGLFREAHGGTLFLDELAHMPLGLQSKLLRVLQEGEVSPVGSSSLHYVDVRIIAATNQPLQGLIERGQFREDLYYRLNVFTIKLPSLRDRLEDIEDLVSFFAQRYTDEFGIDQRRFPPATIAYLRTYDWPGNVRELENCIKRALLMSSTRDIQSADIQLESSGIPGPGRREDAPQEDQTLRELIEQRARPLLNELLGEGQGNLHRIIIGEAERALYEIVLRHTAGNQIQAAAALGVNRNTVRRKIREHDIDLQDLRHRNQP